MKSTAITCFDRVNLSALRSEIEEALQTVAERRGISISLGRGKFTPQTFSIKIGCATKSSDGQAQTKESIEWKRSASLMGLNPDWLGRTFTSSSGMKFQVTGLNLRARRMPVLAVQVGTDKPFKFTAQSVREAFNGKA